MSATRRYITRPRLKDFDYTGTYTYHLVLTTRGRQAVLTGAVADNCISELGESAALHEFEVLAFAVMPNHVHLLIVGLSAQSNAIRFVQRLKQKTSYAWVQEHGEKLWQPSFYDHAIRHQEEVKQTARYIVENPVRAGLTRVWDDWPLLGGTLVAPRGRS